MPGYHVQWHLQQPKQKYVEVQSKHESVSSFPKISSSKLTTFNSISPSITTTNVETEGQALNTQVLPVSHTLTGEVINQKKISFRRIIAKDAGIFEEQPEKPKRKVGIVTILGITAGIVGSFIFPLQLGIMAISLGFLGTLFSAFNKEKYGHFGLPLFAIILGLFDICLLIININALTAFFIVLAISLIFLVFFSKLGV
jgi:hypothetical protein